MVKDVAADRKNPQIPVTIGENTKLELDVIAEYLGVTVASLVKEPFGTWQKSPSYASLLRRARNEMAAKPHIDEIARELGEDNEHVKALRKLLCKPD
ncbi:MAG: hypothetical protein AAF773_11730 [Cyanobacteria bacterium P01_D01_bin.115]